MIGRSYPSTPATASGYPAFGNFRDVDITVFKYEDVDMNGVFNTGDSRWRAGSSP